MPWPASRQRVPSRQGHPPTWELRYVGQHGTVVHDLAAGSAIIRRAGQDVVEIPSLPESQRYPSRAVVTRFIDVILARAGNPTPGRLGAEVVALLEAAHDSAANDGTPRAVRRPTLTT